MMMFKLVRETDVSGISGTGDVAEGIVFTDGTVVLRWTTETPTTVIHDSLESVNRIHGHGGMTKIRWVA